MFGVIYIARNSIDGDEVYKVGKTQRTVEERMRELTSETSNLGEYKAIGFVVVNDIDQAEKECHLRLRNYRIQPNREFFKIPLSTLVDAIRAATEPYLVKDELPAMRTSNEVQMDDLIREEQSKFNHGKQKTVVYRDNASRQLALWHKSLINQLGELKDRFHDDPYMEIQIDKQFTGIDWDHEIKNQAFKIKGEYPVGTIVLKGKLIKSPVEIYLNDTDETPDLDDGRYAEFKVFMDCDTKIFDGMKSDFKPKIILTASALCILAKERLVYDEYSKKTALFQNHETANEIITRLVAANTCEVPKIKTTVLDQCEVDDNRRDLKIRFEPMEPFVAHSD